MPSQSNERLDPGPAAERGQPFEPLRAQLGGGASDPAQMRDALHKSEEFNRRIIESSQDCVKVLDLEGNLLFISDAGLRALKIPDVRQILNKPFADFWDEEDQPMVAAAIAAARDGKVGQFRAYCPSPWAEPRYWDVMITPICGADGRPERLLCISRDITACHEAEREREAAAIAKAQAEEALRASEERLRLAIESANLGTWDYDVVGDELTWSERTKAAFGLSADADVDFATFVERLHPEDRHLVVDMKQQTGAPGESKAFQVEYRSRWRDGTERSLLATGRTLFGLIDGHPGVVRCVGTLRDMTDSKQAEALHATLVEELRQSQKMQAIGQLAGGIAHNFNNLLLAVSGHVEILADALTQLPVSDQQKTSLHSVGQLRKAVDIGTGVTRRLLAFCRRQPLHPVLLDPDQAISGMLELLRDVLGPKIALHLKSVGDIGYLYTDLDQVQQAIMNLVLNGRDAMPDGGALTIRTSRIALAETAAAQRGVNPGTFICISVTDTGSGMDEETRKRLFEPFFTTKALGQGTGLGLATVYGFVKQAGGCIDVESQLGEGTTFTLLLPAFSAGPALKEEAMMAARAPGNKAILFCDDNELIRPMIGQYLSEEGYTVAEAEDAEKALELVQRQAEPVDLLVTDIQLPGVDGVELARRLRKLRPAAKCILITGHPDYLPDSEVMASLDATFLCKPFQLPELLRLVDECLSA